MSNDYRGNVSLWKNAPKGDTKPYVKGKFVAHRNISAGETIDIALWVQENKGDNYPVLKGKISDVMSQQGGQSTEDDDEIPF